ncbi:MAG: hypothetical protein ACD_80C00130G0005 [uncultured bacterium (gcode 4)]|uniref:DUF2062 domain-containing protein n=1 Tax=uncultured bacterium (gcode 4) TaxID=1234023 RepID=K1YI44_9BACT|nr:MAG: hypothetical protein ACD_80C00130G0005 [uncultured bacterium (gcode 4)]
MLNRFKAGLVFGCFVSFIHLVWAVAIAITPTGMQKFIDWIFWLHFLQPVYVITQATRGKGILLIIMTFVIWYIMGVVFACLRNKFLGDKKIKIIVQSKVKAKTKK